MKMSHKVCSAVSSAVMAVVLGHNAAIAASPPTVSPLVIQAAKTTLLDMTQVGSSLVVVGERGVVGRSSDSGQTWQFKQAPTTRTLTAVTFIDSKVGVAVGHGGTLLRTEDAGLTWTTVPVKEAGSDAVLGVTALKDGRVVAYGAFAMFLVSTDQGRTWKRETVVSDSFERHISRITETASGALFLVGETGAIARSADGGKTWTELKSPYEGSFFGLLELKDGALLAFGMRGNIFRSSDQGASWAKVPFASKATLNGGSLAADGRVVLAGNRGLLAVSADGGRNFTLSTAPEGMSLAQARLLQDGTLVYVGVMASGRVAPARDGAGAVLNSGK